MRNFKFFDEDIRKFVLKFLDTVKENRDLLKPFSGIANECEAFLKEKGFQIYSTKSDTFVLSDISSKYFIKVFIPVKFKRKIKYFLYNPAKKAYLYSQRLRAQGIPVVEVFGYGKVFGRHFYIMAGSSGTNFLEILKIQNNKDEIAKLFLKIIDITVALHKAGYSLGDANIKHFFFVGDELESIVDLDNIQKIYFFKLKRFARDLGYLWRPVLPFSKEEMKAFFNYYCENMEIFNRKEFFNLIEYYKDRRWS
ncbi:BUD32 family EKC/KEOPS complex subunit [Thermodesulfovibrio hydrogeniphilus]